MARVAATCDNARLRPGREPSGDPTEVAVLLAAQVLGTDTDADRREAGRRWQFHFDPELKLMSTIDRHGDGLVVHTKGAPEAVLPRCSASLDQGAAGTAQRSGRGTHRRPGGRAQAVADCRTAGIRIIVTTGDHPLTAVTIARRVGITDGPPRVISGEELDRLHEYRIAELVRDEPDIIVARASPEAKLHIADALREQGHGVAMTGDGVNDAPALPVGRCHCRSPFSSCWPSTSAARRCRPSP